jgi:hypothetical protein
MPSEMQYEHAKIAYTSDWKTVAWEPKPKAYDPLTFKMSENTPAPEIHQQRKQVDQVQPNKHIP